MPLTDSAERAEGLASQMRLRSTVSTVKKSQARIVWAWAVRNCCQVGPVRRGAGLTPARCRIFQTVLAAIR